MKDMFPDRDFRKKKVYIIVVNWNGWRDTQECLESLLRLEHDNYVVLVCDNASTNGSLQHLEAWASGEELAGHANPQIKQLTNPAIPKPIPFLKIGTNELMERGHVDERLLFVEIDSNLGFAGGNNVGLEIAIADQDMAYAWLINNDTVVDSHALGALLERAEREDRPGMCGSTLLYYRDTNLAQALGGASWNRWTARAHHIGGNTQYNSTIDPEWVEDQMDYIVGASMLISRQFLQDVGLMDTRYFLYSEEIDWATRGVSKFKLGYAPKSLVYHKEGGSIGTQPQFSKQPAIADYYAVRNRILFTSRFHPWSIPTVLISVAVSLLQRVLYGRFSNALALARGVVAGLRGMCA